MAGADLGVSQARVSEIERGDSTTTKARSAVTGKVQRPRTPTGQFAKAS